MTTFTSIPKSIEDALEQRSGRSSRRDFLKTSGVFVVSFGAAAVSPALPFAVAAQGEATAGPYPEPDFRELDTWIAIHENNTATFFVGKTDCGQGTGTAFRQMMSDELDIAYDDTDVIMGSISEESGSNCSMMANTSAGVATLKKSFMGDPQNPHRPPGSPLRTVTDERAGEGIEFPFPRRPRSASVLRLPRGATLGSGRGPACLPLCPTCPP